MPGQFLVWYVTMQFFALAGLPLAFVWLRRLRSRGYVLAKALGLLLTGVVVWWGGILHIWQNTTSAILLAAGLVFAVGMWALWRHRAEVRPWLQEQWAFVLNLARSSPAAMAQICDLIEQAQRGMDERGYLCQPP